MADRRCSRNSWAQRCSGDVASIRHVGPPKCFIVFPDPGRRRERAGEDAVGHCGQAARSDETSRGIGVASDHRSLVTHHSSVTLFRPHPTQSSPRIHARRTVRFSDQTRIHLHNPCASPPAPRGAVTDLLRARSVPRMMMWIARFQALLASGRTRPSIKFRRLVCSNTALKSSSTRLVHRQQTTSQPFFKLSNRSSSASPR